jgi:predicted unusual protein kinase regulating ubiquinone biosynthesis (AarF/ABC1/UbiB family)
MCNVGQSAAGASSSWQVPAGSAAQVAPLRWQEPRPYKAAPPRAGRCESGLCVPRWLASCRSQAGAMALRSCRFVRGSGSLRVCAQRPHGLLAAARRPLVTTMVGRSGGGGGGGGAASTRARVAAAGAALLAGGLAGGALSSLLSPWRSGARAEPMLLGGSTMGGTQGTDDEEAVLTLGGDVGGEAQAAPGGIMEWLRRSCMLVGRVVYLSALSFSVLVPGYVLHSLRRVAGGCLAPPGWLMEGWWRYCLWSIEVAGPTFVKLAQWAASRPDMFPDEFCRRFAVLHDSTTPHAWEHTAECLEKALGTGWEQRLVLEPVVIGSGCIAQVYRGVWHDVPSGSSGAGEGGADSGGKPRGGTRVAVKVGHPDIHEKVEADLRIMKWVSRAYAPGWAGRGELLLMRRGAVTLVVGIACVGVVGAFQACAQLEAWWPATEYLGTFDVVADFEQLMKRQMDLRLEARNLRRFIANFRDETLACPGSVAFPQPLFAEEDVLVETFMDGRPIAEYVFGDHPPEVKRTIADLGVQISLAMVFNHNFIHADLHPGNILVDYDPQAQPPTPPCIVCLDAGLAYQLTKHELFISIVSALMMREGEEAGLHMLENAGKSDVSSPAQIRSYCQGVQRIVEHAMTQQFFEHLGDYIYDFFTLAFTHKVKLDHNFVCVALAIKVPPVPYHPPPSSVPPPPPSAAAAAAATPAVFS